MGATSVKVNSIAAVGKWWRNAWLVCPKGKTADAVCNIAVGRGIVKSTKLVKFGLLKLSATAGKLQL